MNGTILRDAVDADADAIAAIYAPAVETGTASFEEVAPSPAEMARRMAAVRERGLPWLVADVDGMVVGYAYAAPYKDRSGYRFTLEDSVYVSLEQQGHGSGELLLAAVIEAVSGRAYRQMIAMIGGGSPRSVRLHERLGFRHVGRFEGIGMKFGRELEVVLMQRALASGATCRA